MPYDLPYPLGAVVAALQGTQAGEVVGSIVDTKPGTPTTPSFPQPPQTKAPIMLTKPTEKPTPASPATPTQQPAIISSTAGGVANTAQLLQSATLSGKPAAFGGNPIIIGGKQALLSGMVQGLPAGVTAVNVVTQVRGHRGNDHHGLDSLSLDMLPVLYCTGVIKIGK